MRECWGIRTLSVALLECASVLLTKSGYTTPPRATSMPRRPTGTQTSCEPALPEIEGSSVTFLKVSDLCFARSIVTNVFDTTSACVALSELGRLISVKLMFRKPEKYQARFSEGALAAPP